MDNMKVSAFYIIKKTVKVLKKRLFFGRRLRMAEPLDFFADNLWKILPRSKRKAVYAFLNNLVDRILWL